VAINHEKVAPPPEEPGLFHRFRTRVRRNPLLNTAWRAGVFAVGATVLIGGLVMMVTPGPGLLGIVIGLAILATEFAWAQRALHRAKTAADRAKEKAFDPRRRRRNTILGTLTGVLLAAAAAAYLVIYGPTLPWHIEDPTFWT
jgi:uncharacterized protein (TIGR02611 family)